MDARKARELVYQLMALYFDGAEVVHSKQSDMIKPNAPMITLTTISVKRPQHPPTVIIDGVPVSYYPTTMILQADLYTKGAPVELFPYYQEHSSHTIPAENTALNDLVQFCNFVGSEYVANWSCRHDVALAVNGQVMDTTDLINGSGYEYRATVELTLDFTEQAVGYAGILSPASIRHRCPSGAAGDKTGDVYIEPEFMPSASGGGSNELANEPLGWFTQVEIMSEEERSHGEKL